MKISIDTSLKTPTSKNMDFTMTVKRGKHSPSAIWDISAGI